MKLLYRMVAAPLVAIGCLLAAGQLAIVSVNRIVDQFATLKDEKLAAARSLAEVESKLAGVNALLYRTINVIESSDAAAIEAVRQRIGRDTDGQLASLKALAPKVDAAIAQELAGVIENLGKYKANALQALTMAEASPGAAISLLASAERSFTASASALNKVAASVNAEVDAMSKEVVSVSSQARTLIIGLSLGGALASFGLSWWMARRLVVRLDHAVHISEAVARGELDVVVPPGDPDELGRLLNSLNNTVKRLASSLGRIQAASGSINSASSEIAAGSLDLSNRTELTANNLQETAGSIGQLAGSVDDSAASARQASALAESASTVASRGGELVAQVVTTMQDITASSRQISEIIGVIDGIAFQTNILALNAAVEAARAGEQGRGFAVVAGEVRSLAQRCSEAAKQIKGLIGTSVAKVENGSRLVGDAGATMNEIVDAVRKVSEMIAGISASADGQTSGIAQVNRAVGQLDQMTQQNAALVEQSSAAAESLKQQAVRLADVVGEFRFRT